MHAAKAFGAVHAVVDGSIDLYGGEAHALVGENGAGKSTVVKMLAGVHQPDEGELLIEGRPSCSPGRPPPAAGIAVIYQEPTLFPDLTVAENIFMGRQPLLAARRIDRRRDATQAAALFERLGVQLDPGRISRGLSIADQQIVEIAKALSLRGPGDRHGRADRRAVGGRGRAAVRRRPRAAGGRGRGAVHLAPARGGLRDLPAR